MAKFKKGDVVYRLLPSGTVFRYIVRRAHSDGTVTVQTADRDFLNREMRACACNFTASPTEAAKPVFGPLNPRPGLPSH